MASACGLLSTRKNMGKGMEQAEPLTLCGLGRKWMYRPAERALLLFSQVMHQNLFLESEKEIEVNRN